MNAVTFSWESTHQSAPAQWASHHFGDCWLGHKARDKRLVSYAIALAEQPGKLMPQLFTKTYDIEATYQLLRHSEVTPDRIQATHRARVSAAAPEAPAELTGLSGRELEILSLAVDRVLKAVSSVLLALGRLGGHMNRRSDHMLGWITLWRGMKTLRQLVKGAELARRRNKNTKIHHQVPHGIMMVYSRV